MESSKNTKAGQIGFFTVAAEVEYVDAVPPEGKPPEFKYRKVHRIYRNTTGNIAGKDLKSIHTSLIMAFREKYQPIANMTGVVPEVTDCIIINISFLGLMTQEQFEAGVEEAIQAPTAEPGKK